jgi:hypothetical protein
MARLTDGELNALQAMLAAEFAFLIDELISDIGDDYRSTGQEVDDETPAMDLTFSAEESGAWSYQTGDNSFTGGAYGFPFWGATTLNRDSKADDVAEDLAEQIVEQIAECQS